MSIIPKDIIDKTLWSLGNWRYFLARVKAIIKSIFKSLVIAVSCHLSRSLQICGNTVNRFCYYKFWLCPIKIEENQSAENAGVAFVKVANERNEYFWENKQTVMYDEQVRTNKAKD